MCNTSQYLDYLDCKCKNKIIDLIIEKCTEYDDDKTKLVNKTVKNSCKVYIILTIVSTVISTVCTIYFVYYNWFLIKNKDLFTKYNTRKETIIW